MSVVAAHLRSSWMASGKSPTSFRMELVGPTIVIVLDSDLMFLSGDGGWGDCFRRK